MGRRKEHSSMKGRPQQRFQGQYLRLFEYYDGAKEMLLVDVVDDRDFLSELFNAVVDELPAPKKKG